VIIDSVAANVALARSIVAEERPAREKLRGLLTTTTTGGTTMLEKVFYTSVLV
jgi:hypothetical protein